MIQDKLHHVVYHFWQFSMYAIKVRFPSVPVRIHSLFLDRPLSFFPSFAMSALWQNGQEWTSKEFKSSISRALLRLCFESSHSDMFPRISFDSSSIISNSENWDFKVPWPYGFLLLFIYGGFCHCWMASVS